jgi:hypothetical protein
MSEQPRVPAGGPKGGQFASKGGGGGGGGGAGIKLDSDGTTANEEWSEFQKEERGFAWDELKEEAEGGDEEAQGFFEEFPTQAAYNAAMQKSLEEMADNSDPAMIVNLSTLTNEIAKDGEFKSTFDVAGQLPTATGAFGSDLTADRAAQESNLFDIDKGSSPAGGRPKYGLLVDKNHVKHIKENGTLQDEYGTTTVVFKSSVRGQTTLLTKPSGLSAGGASRTVSDYRQDLKDNKRAASGKVYHEAQYHGKLSTKDISHVYVRKPKGMSESQFADQQLRLDKLAKQDGFDWSVVS